MSERNLPTPLGREIGKVVGALAERAELETRLRFGACDKPCKTCAFTTGTLPNGCEETLLDAITCVADAEPFYCHQSFDKNGAPTKLCAGWCAAVSGSYRELFAKMKPPDWDVHRHGRNGVAA